MGKMSWWRECRHCRTRFPYTPELIYSKCGKPLHRFCEKCRTQPVFRVVQRTTPAWKQPKNTTPVVGANGLSRKVYFIQVGENGPIKIGITFSVRKRLSNLQTSVHEKLRCLAWCPGGEHTEEMLHERFWHLRISGEWFKPDQAILAIIEGLRRIRMERPLTHKDLWFLAGVKPR